MTTSSFAPGTFTPAPQRASVRQILRAQGGIESKLMLRHGEQQLLSIVVPMAMLLAGSHVRFSEQVGGIEQLFPMVMAVATTSAGFTGQAISLAFDRRYGALKRSGASGVPAWAIIGGKIIGVLSMVAAQVVVLGITAFAVGFRATPLGLALGAVTLILGVAACTAMGLVLGGTLSSEMVLAMANLIWFILLGLVGLVMYSQGLGHNGWWNLIPTVALAGGLTDAFAGTLPLLPIVSLLVWAAVVSVIAARCFRFDG